MFLRDRKVARKGIIQIVCYDCRSLESLEDGFVPRRGLIAMLTRSDEKV